MNHFPGQLLILTAWLSVSVLFADEYEPQAVSAADFSGLITQSPFNRTLNLNDSLILTGLAVINEQQVATLLDTETKETYLVSGTPNERGWKMLEVKPNQDLERVTAKISLGGEIVNIRYAEVKLKPGDSRPGGGSAAPSPKPAGGRKGPPDDIRKQVGSLSDEQRSKFFNKMREIREKHPDMSQDDHFGAARKVLEKMGRKK